MPHTFGIMYAYGFSELGLSALGAINGVKQKRPATVLFLPKADKRGQVFAPIQAHTAIMH